MWEWRLEPNPRAIFCCCCKNRILIILKEFLCFKKLQEKWILKTWFNSLRKIDVHTLRLRSHIFFMYEAFVITCINNENPLFFLSWSIFLLLTKTNKHFFIQSNLTWQCKMKIEFDGKTRKRIRFTVWTWTGIFRMKMVIKSSGRQIIILLSPLINTI